MRFNVGKLHPLAIKIAAKGCATKPACAGSPPPNQGKRCPILGRGVRVGGPGGAAHRRGFNRQPPLLLLCCLLALLPLASCTAGSATTCQSFQVPNAAMEPSLHQGQIIPVDSAAYASARPKRGATVVVRVPSDPSQRVVLRVVGLPGETLTLTATQTFINGKLLAEPFVLHRGTQQPEQVTLGPDQYFLMGDNRPQSTDSREWGPVPFANILAQWGTQNCPAN